MGKVRGDIKERKGGDQFPIGTDGLLNTVECHLCTSGGKQDINIRRDKRRPDEGPAFIFVPRKVRVLRVRKFRFVVFPSFLSSSEQ